MNENFIQGNFNLCRPFDCECRKMNTAPDGSCVEYKISTKPPVQEYENKKYYKDYVVKNNLYPKKRKNDILIFVGKSMREKKEKFRNLPKLLISFQKTEYGLRTEDKSCKKLFDVFLNLIDMLKYFDDGKDTYLKYLILDVNRLDKDRSIMNSFKIPLDKFPRIYMYNEATRDLKLFKYNPDENNCFTLEELLIFVSNGDIGLISYLNHLQDPFLGIKFKHDSKKNKWVESHAGISTANNGTYLCKLIDYKNLPDEMREKALKNTY